jgi:hypothetical protein
MKTSQEAYNEHFNRIVNAIEMKKTDRPPILLSADVFFLKYAKPDAVCVDLIRRPEWSSDKQIEGIIKLGGGEIDCIERFKPTPVTIGSVWFSNTRLPGRELKEDDLWQVDEVGVMEDEDYDFLIDNGWQAFSSKMLSRLNYTQEEMKLSMDLTMIYNKKLKDNGIVTSTWAMGQPAEAIWGARGMRKFLLDLRRRPEKIKAALEAIFPDYLEGMRKQIRATKTKLVYLASARAGSDFLSPKNFEEFVFYYFKKAVAMLAEEGCKVILHLDSNCDGILSYLKELPEKTCIFNPDGMTDMFKAKEILGGYMCIAGDTPPSLLCLGSPDEVYNYTVKLMKEIGPVGFINSVGCGVPPNAKTENMDAFIAACLGK